MGSRSTDTGEATWTEASEETCARREEILDAATKLFAQHGYSDAVTQALADALAVGKGTIYRYFTSKRELFLAATDRGMRRLRAFVAERVAKAEDPLDKIALGIRAFLEFFDHNPECFELLIQERALFKDCDKPTYVKHREMVRSRWEAIYRDLIARRRLRDLDPARTSVMIGDVLYGVMISNYFGGRRKPSAEQAEEIADLVFFGILSDDERRARKPRVRPCNGEKSNRHASK